MSRLILVLAVVALSGPLSAFFSHVWTPAARAAFANQLAAGATAYQAAHAPPRVPAVPAVAGDYDPTSWALTLLELLGEPATGGNIAAIVAWERAEGGHWRNPARFNPLNTTQPETGAWPINDVGVRAYTSWSQGFSATVTTLRNGLYAPILGALARGTCAACVADAVASSPWGTRRFAP